MASASQQRAAECEEGQQRHGNILEPDDDADRRQPSARVHAQDARLGQRIARDALQYRPRCRQRHARQECRHDARQTKLEYHQIEAAKVRMVFGQGVGQCPRDLLKAHVIRAVTHAREQRCERCNQDDDGGWRRSAVDFDREGPAPLAQWRSSWLSRRFSSCASAERLPPRQVNEEGRADQCHHDADRQLLRAQNDARDDVRHDQHERANHR